MPISALDARPALIVIDLQKGIVARPLAHPIGPVVANAVALAEAFRAHGLPVVLVNVAGGAPGRNELPKMPPPAAGWDDLIPELRRRPGDHCVTKRTWGAFIATGLDEHLRGLGATQAVLCGVATSIGVEGTARQAQERGYNVALAVDAMTDMSLDAHVNSITRIFPRLGETGTTADVLALLATRTVVAG